MSDRKSLTDIFARLDESKANRANETNMEHKRKQEQEEEERQKRQAAASAVERYHVYDDEYDVDDAEDNTIVMIPGKKPAPNASASEHKVSERELDEISNSNPFVQNAFARSKKKNKDPAQATPSTSKKEPPLSVFVGNSVQGDSANVVTRGAPTASSPTAVTNPAPDLSAASEEEPIGETFIGVENLHVPSDDLEIGFDGFDDEPQPTNAYESIVRRSNENEQAQKEEPVQEEKAVPASEGASVREPEVTIPESTPAEKQVTQCTESNSEEMNWPVGMNGPRFSESIIAYGDKPRDVELEEADAYLYSRYDEETGIGAYGLCVDMGKNFVQSARCGETKDYEEFALMGAIELFNALKKNEIHDVVIYTEPDLAKSMIDSASRLTNGKSKVRRDYIDIAWSTMTSISVRFVTTQVQSEYAQLALATTKYLAFRERNNL